MALSDNMIVFVAELISTDEQSIAEIPIAFGEIRPALRPIVFPEMSGPEYPAPPVASSAYMFVPPSPYESITLIV